MKKPNEDDMTLADFVSLFDKRAIEEGRVSFNVYAPLDMGGKWILYCEKDDTYKGLVEFIKSNDCLRCIRLTGLEEVSMEYIHRDDSGKISVRINIHI